MHVALIRDGKIDRLRGPRDLGQADVEGALVLIVGEAKGPEVSRWTAALGHAAMRGATVRRDGVQVSD